MPDSEAKIARRNYLRLSKIERDRIDTLADDYHHNTGEKRADAAVEVERIFERYKAKATHETPNR